MKIGGIQKFSTSDYPGVTSFVVFTPGCNFDCWYCYNRKTLLTKNVDEYDENEVLEMISKRKKLLQGVVLSGGECTLQKDLIDFIYKIKNIGMKVKVDSNGSSPSVIKQLCGLGIVDYFAIDYKCSFFNYNKLCGKSANPDLLKETLLILHNYSVNYEIRTTLIPDISSNELIQMSMELDNIVPRWVLKRFIPDEIDKNVLDNHIDKYNLYNNINKYIHTILEYQPNTIII